MSKTVKVWRDQDWYDSLAEYYNEHHDQIRKEFQVRNFGHWIGALAYLKLSQLKEKEK